MAEKKWVVGLTGFLLVSLLFAGYMAMAAELGSKDDPLVTASYITDELLPNLNKKIDEVLDQKAKEYADNMNKQYDSLVADLQTQIQQFTQGGDSLNDPAFIEAVAAAVIAKQGGSGGSGGGGTSDAMKRVDLEKGKTVTLDIGSEVLLRSDGAAVCVSPGSVGLIDMTTGKEISGGDDLQVNHLYLCTIAEGRGFKTTDKAIVFIRGGYKVS